MKFCSLGDGRQSRASRHQPAAGRQGGVPASPGLGGVAASGAPRRQSVATAGGAPVIAAASASEKAADSEAA